jgi:hypothetical protein
MMEAGTRSIWFFLAFLFASPACAAPLTACDFITQSEVESLLGRPVGQPVVSSRGSCLGWCEAEDTSRCSFSLDAGNASEDFFLEISVPPFLEPEKDLPRDVLRLESDHIVHGRDVVEEVPGFGGPAIYSYRADIGDSSLEVFGKQHFIFVLVHMGVFDQSKAFSTVLRAASFVMKHYRAMPASRFKGGFEYEPPDGSHPWKP